MWHQVTVTTTITIQVFTTPGILHPTALDLTQLLLELDEDGNPIIPDAKDIHTFDEEREIDSNVQVRFVTSNSATYRPMFNIMFTA